MDTHIYEVSVEIEPLPGAEFPSDCVGAFVFCYVSAGDIRSSLDVTEKALRDESYRLLDVDHSLRIELEDYEPHSSDYPSGNDLSNLLVTGGCEFGPFDCYESAEEP